MQKWPLLGPTGTAMGTIFVSRDQNSNRHQARNAISEILRKRTGEKIVVFPSGTTCLDESKPWKKGIFEIAKSLNVPVQLFRLDYRPLRDAAYIDDDNLLLKMASLSKLKNKTVTLTWLKKYDQVSEPAEFAESLRQQCQISNPYANATDS